MVWATLFQMKNEVRVESVKHEENVISFVRFALLG